MKFISYSKTIHKDLLGACTQLCLRVIIGHVKCLGLVDPIFSWGRETINE